MIRRYPQWGDEIKHAIQQGNPPVSRSMLQKPNAIVGNLEVRLVGVQGGVEYFVITSRILRILMEHIDKICSPESELFFISICSVRIRSRKRDILK